MVRRRLPAPVAALAALCALAGCGLGAGATPKQVQLTVTRDFGARVLLQARAPRAVGEETVMSMLRRNAAVGTRYGGGFVQSIDGLAGGSEGGEPVDWFYYVNGVQASKGAASTVVHAGDRIWWDRHDWSQTQDVPAVVGSFPEPFLAGIEGKRLPVRVECTEVESIACQAVLGRLRSLGVLAALATVSGGDEPETLRVLVGPLSKLVADPGVHQIEAGPRYSGVYARVGDEGKMLLLLDAQGRTVRTLGAHSGLVAATRYREEAPVWVITGTDEQGVDRAAGALKEVFLRDHFALVLPNSGPALALPLPEPVAPVVAPPAGALGAPRATAPTSAKP